MWKDKIQESRNIIEDALDNYGNMAVMNSFGKDSIVTSFLVKEQAPNMVNVWVVPPFLPDETIDFAKDVAKFWNLHLLKVESDLVDDEDFMEDVVRAQDWPNERPEQCCETFKVEPAQRAVKELKLEAWFSGLRSTESEKRSHYTAFWEQGEENITKVHPIINWTEEEIWNFIRDLDLPQHPWYDDDYRSLGCAPCSAPGGEHERDGRWKDTQKQGGGCGLHCVAHPKYSGEGEE